MWNFPQYVTSLSSNAKPETQNPKPIPATQYVGWLSGFVHMEGGRVSTVRTGDENNAVVMGRARTSPYKLLSETHETLYGCCTDYRIEILLTAVKDNNPPLWLWVYYNRVPIYPIFYLLKGTIYSLIWKNKGSLGSNHYVKYNKN